MTSFEDTENSREASQETGGLSVKILSGGYQKTNEDVISKKSVFETHDLITTDVLSYLQSNGFIHEDYANAPNGSLILVKGKLFFNDKVLLSVVAQIFTAATQQGEPLLQSDDEQKLGAILVQEMTSKDFFRPICFLQTDKGQIIAGTVKEAQLEEPVSSYYLKYGSSGLPDVYIIGVKEDEVLLDEKNLSELVKNLGELTDKISEMLIGVDSLKMTSLAIYRKIERAPQTQLSEIAKA